jgi:hypothetical protein
MPLPVAQMQCRSEYLEVACVGFNLKLAMPPSRRKLPCSSSWTSQVRRRGGELEPAIGPGPSLSLGPGLAVAPAPDSESSPIIPRLPGARRRGDRALPAPCHPAATSRGATSRWQRRLIQVEHRATARAHTACIGSHRAAAQTDSGATVRDRGKIEPGALAL